MRLLMAVMVAGAFGSYIRIESAQRIGLLPVIPGGRVVAVGNAAGDGARLALVSRSQRELARELAARARHIELSAHPDFRREFLQALQFPVI
ncbi:protein of unknown function (DUF4445) [Carboxydocella thermautotrophica]|nr:protein of unknown function (DUF4445) [Carboxydocella thermautotrophica]